MAEGRKDDQGKAPLWHLGYVSGALAQVAKVLEVGGAKYGVENWRKVPDFRNRYASALLRHGFAYLKGEENDPDDGLPHLAHLICCALFLLEGPATIDALAPRRNAVPEPPPWTPKVGDTVEVWQLNYKESSFDNSYGGRWNRAAVADISESPPGVWVTFRKEEVDSDAFALCGCGPYFRRPNQYRKPLA